MESTADVLKPLRLFFCQVKNPIEQAIGTEIQVVATKYGRLYSTMNQWVT